MSGFGSTSPFEGLHNVLNRTTGNKEAQILAKKVLRKYFHGLTDSQFEEMLSEYPINNVFGAMDEYSLRIAEKAIRDYQGESWTGRWLSESMACDEILSRIKELTEGRNG